MNLLPPNPGEMNKIEPVEQIPLLDQENGAYNAWQKNLAGGVDFSTFFVDLSSNDRSTGKY